MIQTIEFDAFGIHYKTQQFPAVEALAMMEFRIGQKIHPTYMLRHTWTHAVDHDWVCLDRPAPIDMYVRDAADLMAPQLVLKGVMDLVDDYTFGFLAGWKGIRVPNRFIIDAKTVETAHTDGVIAQLINAHVATLKELEEYYSLEDAFKMFDVIMAKSVNEALSHEAAMRESKRQHHA